MKALIYSSSSQDGGGSVANSTIPQKHCIVCNQSCQWHLGCVFTRISELNEKQTQVAIEAKVEQLRNGINGKA